MDQPEANEHNRPGRDQPNVAVILEVDRDYRQLAEAGKLPLGELPEKRVRRVPVLTRQYDDWRLTAFCKDDSDKVVVYCRHARRNNVKRTFVTTAKQGRLAGKRIIRGRRTECADYYRHRATVPISILLELDRDYRQQAEAGELPLGELPEKHSRWLPVL
ncbi:MAG: hypothetical protein OES26_20205, partial [Gammaproteobacteria bacterium]|nr:hypothetical protein [Gammaproteobacteria bacterium]